MKFLIALAAFYSVSALAFSPVPALTPGTAEYNAVKDTLYEAAKDFNIRNVDFKFRTLAGQYAIQLNQTRPNREDLAFEINGQLYSVPSQLVSTDNFRRFVVSDGTNGTKPGIYLVQTGFRMDDNTDLPARITITLRLADQNGNLLQTLEYEEMGEPAQGPTFREMYPRPAQLEFAARLKAPARPQRQSRLTPQKDDIVAPWWDQYTPAQMCYNADTHPEMGWHYFRWAFRHLSGEIFVNGAGQIPTNDGWQFVSLAGQFYKILFDYYQVDNWTSFKLVDTGSKPGIYLIQRGVRFVNGDTNNLERVVAEVRLTDASLNPLPELEYHEESFPTVFADSELIIERVY